jgi:hypothetical protein
MTTERGFDEIMPLIAGPRHYHVTPDKQMKNQADLPLVTFDNNVLVALRGNEPDTPAAHILLELNRADLICLNVTMSTAMEAQRPGEEVEWSDVIARIESLGVPRENIFTTSRSVGFAVPTLPDILFFDIQLEQQLVERIHEILCPTVEFTWPPFRDRMTSDLTPIQRQAGLELDTMKHGTWIPPRPTPTLDTLTASEREELQTHLEDLCHSWFNAKNDAMGFHAHLTLGWHTSHPEHSVFVTRDKNFGRRQSWQRFDS